MDHFSTEDNGRSYSRRDSGEAQEALTAVSLPGLGEKPAPGDAGAWGTCWVWSCSLRGGRQWRAAAWIPAGLIIA